MNGQLVSGSDLMNSLTGILLRFRQEPIAIMADIESRVHKEDCDCLEFYWWPNGDISREQVIYKTLVHLFCAISSPCCSNTALRQTAIDQTLFDTDLADKIMKSLFFCVDDYLSSVANEAKAI